MPTTTTKAHQYGLAVLLVYGLKVPVPREGRPGFRLTVQVDGTVHVEPVGYGSPYDANLASFDLQVECTSLGLKVSPIPFGFAVSRR